MATFIMLTRLNPDVLKSPLHLIELSNKVRDKIEKECPTVEWKANYAVLGPTDYVDIFAAPDVETAAKVATIIRTFGFASTEIWAAIDWDRFKAMLPEIDSGGAASG